MNIKTQTLRPIEKREHSSSKWSFLSLFSTSLDLYSPFFPIHLISIAAQAPQMHLIVIASLIQSPCEAFNCSWPCTKKITLGGGGGRERGKGGSEQRGKLDLTSRGL